MTRPQSWIGSASLDHVRTGVRGGFCQLSHGRSEALRLMRRGDGIVYYSGREEFGTQVPCQKFTAIGRILGSEPYQVAKRDGFRPYRRDALYLRSRPADIRPLIPALGFIADKRHWGLPFRRGYVRVTEADFQTIARAMLGHPFTASKGASDARDRRK